MVELPTFVQVVVVPPPFPSVVVVMYVPEPTLVVIEPAIAPPATKRPKITLTVIVFIRNSISSVIAAAVRSEINVLNEVA